MNLIIKKTNFYGFLTAIFGALIIALIPWPSLREAPYIDRANNAGYIDHAPNRISWFDYDTAISKISYEYGWHWFLAFCTETLSLNSEQIFFFISFCLLFASILLISIKYNRWGFIFLLNPIFIDFAFSQLRLAFAMTIIYVAYFLYSRSNKLYIPLILIVPFIHTSTLLFIFVFAAAIFLESLKTKSQVLKTTAAVAAGSLIAIVTGPLMAKILSSFNDRRADYEDMSSPLLYMIFWIVYYLYLIIKAYLEKIPRDISFYISLIILTVVFFNSFLSGYSSRFLAACFPFIILTLLKINGSEKPIIWLAYIGYTLMLWWFWAF